MILYIVDFCTELDRLGFLFLYDRTYIMAVNADNAVADLPSFQTFPLPVQGPF